MTKEQVRNLIKSKDDPVWFATNFFSIELEEYQKEVLTAISKTNKVAWRSGHGVGKTTVAAITAIWYLLTRPYSKIITTASSWRQVAKVLWPEIHKWLRNANWDLIGKPTNMEKLKLEISLGPDWFASGQASDVPEKLEGFHADYMLYIVDEAKIVPKGTFESIEGALTSGKEAKMLVISTPPPEMAGYFYEVFSRKRLGFEIFHTSAVDSKRVNPEWVEARREEWGVDSPVYQTRVLGEFAESGEDNLIPLKWIESAVGRVVKDGTVDIGVDVARFGSDKTVIATRSGQRLVDLDTYSKEDTMKTTGRVIAAIKKHGPESVKVDVIGIGAGVVDRLLEQDQEVDGVNVAEKADDSEKFLNRRAELYWGLRERFQQGDVSIPDDEGLIGELANIKYEFTSRGQIKIEAKEKMKKRGMKSPDMADAVMLAFAKDVGSSVDMMVF